MPQTSAIRADKEFKDWVARQPKADPDEPEKGNRTPPEPLQDLTEPREPGTSSPEGV